MNQDVPTIRAAHAHGAPGRHPRVAEPARGPGDRRRYWTLPVGLLTLLTVVGCVSVQTRTGTDGTSLPVGDGGAGAIPSTSVRSFDPATAARLGRELYRHDQLAWAATDALQAVVSQAERARAGATGWIVELSGPEPLVRFVVQKGDEPPHAGWDVRFRRGGAPTVGKPADSRLLPRQAIHYAAIKTATRALQQGHHPYCGTPQYNTVVLEDPDGPGLLVYILRPKTRPDRVPLTGHYRISVSADGARAIDVARFGVSCLDGELIVKGNRAQSIITSQLVAPRPLETYVFLSLQENLSIYVLTPDKRMWRAKQGELVAIGKIGDTNGAE